ncbi:MAG: LysM peptidoglycan-binding domain-containing protein [Acidobacteriota bacterium]|nr:MAG: LysM peptidoglycan-binding domain-containing protein [Acidobacteriota bacterium]
MEKRQSGVSLRFGRGNLFFIKCFCAVALTAILLAPVSAQIRGTGVYTEGINDVSTRSSEIQRVIDRSNGYFHSGEVNFKDGNFEKARREYDRAIDTFLESGMDIRGDARLQQHFQNLVAHIYQRQMTLLTVAPPTSQVVFVQDNHPGKPQPTSDDGGKDRGFGQQSFTASPLDDLAKLKLSEEETRDATDAQAESAVVAARLDFQFRPNALIQSYINYYNGRGRATMEQGLRRAGRFLDMARTIFHEEGVPQDLVWLGQVESAWSPVARSWAAAVGLWQFIPGTGARYGLRQDYYIDERSSFEKATRASARYLKFLANRYDGNWELAMAAYNSGEGRVDSAIARSGYADFWEIYSRGLLPNETRNYVPNILATIIIAKNPAKYGFEVKPEPPLSYDYVKVNNMVDLKLVADATDSSFDLLRALNPELKRGVTPPGIDYMLRVPQGKGRVVMAALQRIPVDKRDSWRMVTAQSSDTFETIADRTGVSADLLARINGESITPGEKVVVPAGGNVRNVVSTTSRASSNSSAKVVSYRVRRGDTLGRIAGRYSTSTSAIANLNGIRTNSKLRAGQVLRIPVRR